MVGFEGQAGDSEEGRRDDMRATLTLSSEAYQEFENLVCDWLLRSEEEERMQVGSNCLRELATLCAAWGSYHNKVAPKDFDGANIEKRQRVYSEIVAQFHSEEIQNRRVSEALQEVERRSMYFDQLRIRRLREHEKR